MDTKKDITVLGMDVADALKMIISLGVVVPTWRNDKMPELPLEMPEDPNSGPVD